MSAARILGGLLPLVLLVAAAGIPWMLRWERRHPTSYTRRPAVAPELASWRALSAEDQEAADTAVLNRGEQADLDAVDNAREAAQVAVERAVQINTLTRP